MEISWLLNPEIPIATSLSIGHHGSLDDIHVQPTRTISTCQSSLQGKDLKWHFNIKGTGHMTTSYQGRVKSHSDVPF